MKRGLTWMLLMLLPLAALADGMVIPSVAFPAKVTIPDQRALIHFTNGVERLVIETRFTGAGTNFAWVVPLPSQPVVEPGSTGLFPTLQYLFAPRIINQVTRYYRGILIFMGVCYLVFLVQPDKRLNALDVAACVLVAACAGVNVPMIGLATFILLIIPVLMVRLLKRPPPSVLLVAVVLLLFAIFFLPPSLSKAGMNPETVGQTVSVLDRRLVGIFETVTLSSQDSGALQTWLSGNGFSLSTNAEPVIASYVQDGWVFVAAKVRRESVAAETSTPHPLSFTFKTDKPVYPMRLTGVDNGPVRVELYVFGPSRAKAPQFKVERCAQPNYPPVPDRDNYWHANRTRRLPATLNVLHPLLREWVIGSPVATKLSATLSPARMRRDVWLEWEPFSAAQQTVFSDTAAWTIVLNWGSGVLGLGLIAAILLAVGSEIQKRMLPAHIRVIVTTALVSAAVIYAWLPKIPVRLTRLPGYKTEAALRRLCDWLSDTNALPPGDLHAEIARVLSNPTKDVRWTAFANRSSFRGWENELLGGPIREEDSPGNFTLRESGNFVQFVVFDNEGAEHVMDRWYLPRHP